MTSDIPVILLEAQDGPNEDKDPLDRNPELHKFQLLPLARGSGSGPPSPSLTCCCLLGRPCPYVWVPLCPLRPSGRDTFLPPGLHRSFLAPLCIRNLRAYLVQKNNG